jgi:hypothetical protein
MLISLIHRGSCAALLCAGVVATAASVPVAPFAIQLLDADTSRPIPLVTLETTFNTRYITDSNGLVAFDEPLAMDRDVFFKPTSPGYTFEAPGLAMGGKTLHTAPGSSATLIMQREMIGERHYRITGACIYRDTMELGWRAPVAQPLLNAGVVGQDSALCTVFQGRLFWIWGDTTSIRHPLGNFRSTGAWSDLPTSGGLPVDRGVDLHYITDGDFVKAMVPRQPGDKSGMYWMSCLMTLPDAEGREHMLAFADNIEGSTMKSLNRRIMEFDETAEEFMPVADWSSSATIQPSGHAVRVRMPVILTSGTATGGEREKNVGPPYMEDDYILFTGNGKQTRVRAFYEAAKDPTRYEAVDLKLNPVDAATGKPIKPHACSIAWSDFRKCWTMILSEIGGSSFLGEVWYLEARAPNGPWTRAVKVVTHDDYTLYNPLQHPELTPAGSPYLYFEGPYAKTFSGAVVGTPWYDYNQVMFRVDLRDPRVARRR